MPKENEKRVTVTISGMPVDLLRDLEAMAKAEHRDRSSQIVKLVEDSVKQARRQAQAAQAA